MIELSEIDTLVTYFTSVCTLQQSGRLRVLQVGL